MSKKQSKLHRKICRLLKKLNYGRFLHHFGPKKFTLAQHLVALLIKEMSRLSFRRVVLIFGIFDFEVPTYSTLCKSRKRIPHYLWNSLLQLTSGLQHEKVAIDGTGFSRTNPSFHYVKRINAKKPVKRFAKLSALFGIKRRKFCALRIRAKPRHDIQDASYLMKRVSVMKSLYADAAYDSESLHEICFNRNVQTFIKPRKNVRRGFYRKKQMKNYSDEEYHQRSLVESGFGSLKRKYGGSVSGKTIVSVKPEIFCKAICHNLGLC
ncbi:MAG: IS5 family transposase [archaeon]